MGCKGKKYVDPYKISFLKAVKKKKFSIFFYIIIWITSLCTYIRYFSNTAYCENVISYVLRPWLCQYAVISYVLRPWYAVLFCNHITTGGTVRKNTSKNMQSQLLLQIMGTSLGIELKVKLKNPSSSVKNHWIVNVFFQCITTALQAYHPCYTFLHMCTVQYNKQYCTVYFTHLCTFVLYSIVLYILFQLMCLLYSNFLVIETVLVGDNNFCIIVISFNI